MKNAASAVAAILISAACIGSATAQSGFAYNPDGAPLHGAGYQPAGGYPNPAFSYGGGYHANRSGGFYYGGAGSSRLGGAYQAPGTGNRFGTQR